MKLNSMMLPKWFVLLTIILVHRATLIGVHGHGWMMSPVPRSGGGAGTGNASTGGPCGKAGPTTVTATWVRGTAVNIQYARANSHGNTGNTVTLILSYNASTTTPTTNHFLAANGAIVLASAATMNVGISGPQGPTITLPNNLTLGTAVLQFRWNPTSGGSWFDCAYVQVVASGAGAGAGTTSVCSTNNGGCATTATCAGTTTATCTCKPGYFGDGRTCTRMPDDVQVKLTVNGNVSQDTFTTNIASLLQVGVGRVLYDDATVVSGNSVVNFYVAGNPVTGESAENVVKTFRAQVGRGETSVTSTVGYQVLNVQVVGLDTTPLAFGSGDPESSSSDSSMSSTTIGIIIGVCVGGVLVLMIAFFIGRRRRQNAGSQLYQPRHTNNTTPQATPMTTFPSKSTTPAVTSSTNLRNTTSPSSPTNTTATHGWRQYNNEQNIPYYFNHITGESRWEAPPEMLQV